VRVDILSVKTSFVVNHEHLPRIWIDTLVRTKQNKRAMRFGTWNVRSMYRQVHLQQQAGN
jgi:hypothetical protein